VMWQKLPKQGMFCHTSSSERSATECAWKRW